MLWAASGASAGPHPARKLVPQGDLSRHYRHGGQAGDEVGPVRVIPEEGTVLQTPHHHVAEGSRGIEAWWRGMASAGEHNVMNVAWSPITRERNPGDRPGDPLPIRGSSGCGRD